MKPDISHISQIKVVSNTHWDREFRWSFEKTRRRLMTMLDTTLDILEQDPAFHSFTMDGHTIMIEDYLEMRPERREQVERMIRTGRLIIGPYYTLAEEFSISHEALVRNLLWGRRIMDKYGAPPVATAYTPSSWGQTGQLPQILADFGCTRAMFYRGISHHESDAEWIWQAPDGTRLLASRFAVYARYNWYYQVHRPVTSGLTFDKTYTWGRRDEAPFRYADGLAGEDLSFMLLDPAAEYDAAPLQAAIRAMLEAEGRHFTTEVFLAMDGHDISVAHPLTTRMVADAQQIFAGEYAIEQTDLDHYWDEVERHLDLADLPVLTGERRAYLKQGQWTFLFPGTISARTYLKQQDFAATTRLVYYAEPLAALAAFYGDAYPTRYLDRGWSTLLSNHTHDANGGCAPDHVCLDMEYRYRLTADVADIVTEDAMGYIVKHLAPGEGSADCMQLVVFNPLPFPRDQVALVDLEVPAHYLAKSVALSAAGDEAVPLQPISAEKSSAFVDNIWDVPTITGTSRQKFYARLQNLPALGYRTYQLTPQVHELRTHGTLLTGPNTMENAVLIVKVNGNGTVDLTCKQTGKVYHGLNYFSDQGEAGNAWKHVTPCFDKVYHTLGASAQVAVVENGPLVSVISADLTFQVPECLLNDTMRSAHLAALPLHVEYRLEAGADVVKVRVTLDNRAKDHWLRAQFPTDIATDVSWADSHFDVVSRAIPLPDSTGWVEPAGGTHPLRTFVDLSAGVQGFAVLPKGLFEYEVAEDERRTLALTLIRACSIKLAVSEEKTTVLPDKGVQCPGEHTFEYALCPHRGDWAVAGLLAKAAELYTPTRIIMTSRGKGALPPEAGLFAIDTPNLHVTAVKHAEDGSGLVLRLFNPLAKTADATLTFARPLATAMLCRMDESEVAPLPVAGHTTMHISVPAKKIMTYKVTF